MNIKPLTMLTFAQHPNSSKCNGSHRITARRTSSTHPTPNPEKEKKENIFFWNRYFEVQSKKGTSRFLSLEGSKIVNEH